MPAQIVHPRIAIVRNYLNENDNKIGSFDFSDLPGPGPIEGNQFFIFKATPTATTSTINPFTDSQSNAGAVWESEFNAETNVIGGFYLFLTARLRPGAAGTLNDNIVTLEMDGVEVARITVDATTQKCGLQLNYFPAVNTRITMDGSAPLVIKLTTVDADLQIIGEMVAYAAP